MALIKFFQYVLKMNCECATTIVLVVLYLTRTIPVINNSISDIKITSICKAKKNTYPFQRLVCIGARHVEVHYAKQTVIAATHVARQRGH